MELTPHGTIIIDGCKARHNAYGKWDVSRSGINIGEADTLAEVPILIERQRVVVRERLACIEAEVLARKHARKDSFSI